MKLLEKPKHERPREKLQVKGVGSLSDLELIMAIIGSGNAQADVTKISRALKKLLDEKASELTYKDIAGVKGMGPAKASKFFASFELWRRKFEVNERPIIDSPAKAADQLKDIRDKKQEYFVCLTLDGANRLIAKRTITIGTLTSSLVHPREVFADAITDRAASIIVAHNHPSGSLDQSAADVEVTERLKESAKLLGINLVDHVVVTAKGFSSINTGPS